MKSITTNIKKIILSQLGLVVIILLIILGVVLVRSLYHNKTTAKINDICGALASSYGTDTLTTDESQNSNYIIWIHLEAPVQISFTNIVSTYNPLFAIVDNDKPCYKIGGAPNMELNSWMWVGYLNGDTKQPFKAHLSKGKHTLIIIGRYVSIDRVEVLTQGCTPTKNQSSCL